MKAIKDSEVHKMQEALATQRIAIIGGNENWTKKIHALFPDWIVIPATNNTFRVGKLHNANYIFIFTNTMGHSAYKKVIDMIRERDLDYDYISGVNIENNIRFMYNRVNG